MTKAPASSTSLAFVRALGALGLHRVAVLAPYPEEASRAFVRFVGEWSIEVCGFEWLGAPSGWDSAVMAPAAIVAAARRVDRPDAEAVLVPDTALPTLTFVEELERVLGKPVLTANQVTIWEGLRLARSGLRPVGYGRLLASTASGGV